jgi:hypothetical protein
MRILAQRQQPTLTKLTCVSLSSEINESAITHLTTLNRISTPLHSQHKENIDEIFVSMDSHHRMHIAHGIFWMDAEGASPAPYTVILNADVEAGLWRPRDDAPDILDYVKYVSTSLCEYVHLQLSLLPHCHAHPLTPSPTRIDRIGP